MVPDLSAHGKVTFAFITYLLFCILYAVNNTGYGTLLSLLTSDVKERRVLNSFKVFGSGTGSLLVSFLTLPLVALCGVQGRFSFAPVAVIYGVINLVLLGNCSINGIAALCGKKPVMDFALCDRSLCYGCYDTAEPEHYVLREIYFDG